MRTGASLVAGAAVIAAALAQSPAIQASSTGGGGFVTVLPSPEGNYQSANFNPLIASGFDYGTQGLLYEPLMMENFFTSSLNPWLATSDSWSNKGTTLTFKLRHGVRWSDGHAFTARDVAFTFNLIKQHRALDGNNVWAYLKSVNAPSRHTVVLTLKALNSTSVDFVAQQLIVPEHLWTSVKHPSKWLNSHPVGTGPFLLKDFSPENISYAKNPGYWQKGLPHVAGVNYPAYTSNTPAALALVKGQIDWAGIFSAGIGQTYTKSNPQTHHYYFPPSNVVMLYTNDVVYPFNNYLVRRALSLAIDRNALSRIGEYGYEAPANLTGLVLPADSSYLVPSLLKRYPNTQNVAEAKAILSKLGFKLDSAGVLMTPKGKPFAFKLNVVAGWTDWDQDCALIAQQLKALGIQVTVNQVAFGTYFTALQLGHFQAAISWTDPGVTPFFLYQYLENFRETAPIGKPANTNWERWNSPLTQKYLNGYETTLSPTIQAKDIRGLEYVTAKYLPTIPLLEGAQWYEYSTQNFTGWPDAKNLYAEPSPYEWPQAEVTLLHIRPK